jgi:hypothetical protein
LLSAKEAAAHLGVSEAYLAKLRSEGGGCPYVKIGTRCLYHPDDLAAYVASRRRHSTSDVREVA